MFSSAKNFNFNQHMFYIKNWFAVDLCLACYKLCLNMDVFKFRFISFHCYYKIKSHFEFCFHTWKITIKFFKIIRNRDSICGDVSKFQNCCMITIDSEKFFKNKKQSEWSRVIGRKMAIKHDRNLWDWSYYAALENAIKYGNIHLMNEMKCTEHLHSADVKNFLEY
jgi:hypothetical protein